MPIFTFRLARLVVASGLLVLATFASGQAQEPPVDPRAADIEIPREDAGGFLPVSQLATPEIDYENCGPVPAAWHPPIYYPEPTLYCPTGVVDRDWIRQVSLDHHVEHRQRMLEKDYQWRAQNAGQSACCPPHSCWGHSSECCPGVGSRKSWWCGLFGSKKSSCSCGSACGTTSCSCGSACGTTQERACGSACATQPGCISLGGQTSSVEAINLSDPGMVLAEQADDAGLDEGIVQISDERFAQANDSGVEPAGFCQISDGCAPAAGPSYCQPGWTGSQHCPLPGSSHHCPLHGGGHHCPLHGGGHHCPLSWGHGFGHGHGGWDECEPDGPSCDCLVCHLRHCCLHPFGDLCQLLYADGPRGYGGWRREIPAMGFYHLAYPVNPYHFDKRDGRIYAAQGYGHPVGVPLAPNVEHTYNYGWGIPSSRLSPVSRMPGAPGVANPAVPGAVGPGIYPPMIIMSQPVPAEDATETGTEPETQPMQ